MCGMRRTDITGQRFGRLVVEGYSRSERGAAVWSCLCDCGTRIETKGLYLRCGDTLAASREPPAQSA